MSLAETQVLGFLLDVCSEDEGKGRRQGSHGECDVGSSRRRRGELVASVGDEEGARHRGSRLASECEERSQREDLSS